MLLLLAFKPEHPGDGTNLNNPYYEFFFSALNTNAERTHFLENFKDYTIIEGINMLIQSFIYYPFYDPEIIRYTKTPGDIRKITKWQKNFYLNIYNEFKDNQTSFTDYSALLQNKSFAFLNDLETEEGFRQTMIYYNSKTGQTTQKEDFKAGFDYLLTQTFDKID